MQTRVQPPCSPHALGTRAVALAAAGLLAATPAIALDDGKYTLFAEETLTYDSNVFRIPSGVDPVTITGSPRRSDWYYTAILGASFDVPVSRQRFQGSYVWNDNRYTHYDQLDYHGYDGRIVWLWQLGNDANGHLGYSNASAPAAYATVSGRTTDLLRTKQAFADGTYELDSQWRVHAGVIALEQRNTNALNQIDNIDITTVDAALNYVNPANDSIGAIGKFEDGHYPNRDFAPGDLLPHQYRQYEAGIAVDWTPTGHSRFRARLEYARRYFDQLPQYDWDGAVGRIEWEWKPTGKLTVTTIARREINPYTDQKANFMLVKGITVTPNWAATEKIGVTGIFDYSVRDYFDGQQLACGLVPGPSDRIRTASLTATYRAATWLSFTLGGSWQKCTSDLPLGNYVAGIGTLGVRVAF